MTRSAGSHELRQNSVALVPPLYAHRLGRAYGPDSSASALAGALAADVDGVETDLWLSADGDLILLHNGWLPAGTDLDGWVQERTSRELRGARLRDVDGELTRESPLFLDDLLAAAPADLVLQLEVKAHADPGLALRTVNALAERRDALAGRPVEVLSFLSVACARAAELGMRARLVVWADYAIDALAHWARDHHLIGVCVEHFLLSHSLVDTLRGRGLSVATGTINDRAILERVLQFAPDAITTDHPCALRLALTPARRMVHTPPRSATITRSARTISASSSVNLEPPPVRGSV